jgi:MFS family permease
MPPRPNGARSLGVYRFWRDLGYAIGALLAGLIADLVGIGWAIGVVGGLTLLSGVVTAVVMVENRTYQVKQRAARSENA